MKITKWESENDTTSYSRMLAGICDAIHAGFYLRQKRYLSAMQNGLDALRIMREAQQIDSTNYEVDFFLGLYEYARAELRSRLWWVLFWYPGNRQQGIKRVRRCAQQAIITSAAAKLSLCDMYIQEKRFKDAEKTIKQLKQEYPKSRFVLWAEVKYFVAEKRYKNASALYHRLSHSYQNEEHGEYNAFYSRSQRALMLFHAGDITNAKRLCDELLSDKNITKYRKVNKETAKLAERCKNALDRKKRRM